jgi:membrane protein required for colicin V production
MLSCLLLLNSILDSLGFWDVLLGIPLIYGLYKGLRNGIVVEIASILALIAGIYGVMHFSYIASDFLQERFSWDSRTIKLAAFALTFLAILFAVHLLGRFLTRIINLTGLGILNVLTGGVFGVLKVALILGALFVFYERASQTTGLMESDQLKHSFLYAPLKELGAIAFDHILEPENFTSE